MLTKRKTAIIQKAERRFLYLHDGPGFPLEICFPSSPHLSRGEEFFLTCTPFALNDQRSILTSQSVQHTTHGFVGLGSIK